MFYTLSLICLLAAVVLFVLAVRRGNRMGALTAVGLGVAALAAATALNLSGLGPEPLVRSQWSERQVRDACEAAVAREATTDRVPGERFAPSWYPASGVWQWELRGQTRTGDRWVDTIWVCQVRDADGAVFLSVKP